MAQIACDFVRLIDKIRLLSSSFGLGGHFRKKKQYWFSAVSLIFIEPGTSRRVDFSPPRSDISRYALVFFPLRIDDFNCFLLRNPMNFNCFFRHLNCVNTEIRSLIRVLIRFEFLNVHDLGSRSRNDLDLQYSHIFIKSFSCLYLPTFWSQASMVSEKSTVFTFSYRKA